MKNTAKSIVTLRNRSHQPSKAEMEENIKVQVPGADVKEKMDNFGRAITRPVNVKYSRK